jgi:hypothetical protein
MVRRIGEAGAKSLYKIKEKVKARNITYFTVFVDLGPSNLQLMFVDCLLHLLVQCPKNERKEASQVYAD